MSDHFDFRLACDLRADIPAQVLDTLRYMTRDVGYAFADPPAHKFFAAEDIDGEVYERWRDFLQCHDGYTPGRFGSSLHRAYRGMQPGGQDIYLHTLDVHCYVHDDEWGYYLVFCQWLAPYCATSGFVGYFLNETTAELELLYFDNGRLGVTHVDRA